MSTAKRSKLRRALSASVRVLLVAVFGVQAIALYFTQQEVVLPDFLREQIIKFAQPAGTCLEINSIKINRLTHFTAIGIKLSQSAGAEPIVSAQNIYFTCNLPAIFFGGKSTLSCGVGGLELACPSMASKTGARTVVLSDGRIDFSRRGSSYLHFSTIRGKLGSTPFNASGDIPITVLTGIARGNQNQTAAEIPTQEKANGLSKPKQQEKKVYGAIVEITKKLDEINAAQDEYLPNGKLALYADFDFSDETNDIVLTVSALCENYSHDDLNLKVNGVSAAQTFTFIAESGTLQMNKPIRARINEVHGIAGNPGLLERWELSASHIDFAADAAFRFSRDTGVDFKCNTAGIRAANFTAKHFLRGKFDLGGILAEVSSDNFFAPENISVLANAAAFNSPVTAKASFSPAAGTQILFSGEFDLPRLLSIPQISGAIPEDVKQFELIDAPHVHGTISLDKEFKFVAATYQLETGPAKWKMVRANSIYSYGIITPEELDIRLAKITGETYCANARIFTELNSHGKYRIQAFGSIENPEVLDDYLGWFWWRIWNNIKRAPSKNAPRADFDVYGTWDRRSQWESVYGSVVGENALGGGVLVDKVRLRVAEEPNLITAFDMGFVRGENLVTGTLQWHYEQKPEYHFRDFRCAFSGQMPPHDVFKIVGLGLEDKFAKILERDDPAKADVIVFVSGDKKFSPIERQLVEVNVKSAPGKFAFLGIEGENFCGKINYDTGNVSTTFSANAQEGKMNGNVLINFPEDFSATGTKVALDLQLTEFPGDRLSTAFQTLGNAVDTSQKSVETEDTTSAAIPQNTDSSDKEKFADKMRINAHFAGTMTLPEIKTLTGKGNFSLTDPALFDLHIFGNFSRILTTIKIPLTSFAFTNSSGEFTVKNGKIILPELKISGESGEIKGPISMNLENSELNGKVVFTNRRFTGIPLFGKLVELVSNSTRLLPIEISGTLDNVEWNIRPFSFEEKEKIEAEEKIEQNKAQHHDANER